MSFSNENIRRIDEAIQLSLVFFHELYITAYFQEKPIFNSTESQNTVSEDSSDVGTDGLDNKHRQAISEFMQKNTDKAPSENLGAEVYALPYNLTVTDFAALQVGWYMIVDTLQKVIGLAVITDIIMFTSTIETTVVMTFKGSHILKDMFEEKPQWLKQAQQQPSQTQEIPRVRIDEDGNVYVNEVVTEEELTPQEIIKSDSLWEAIKTAVRNINNNRIYNGGKSNTPQPKVEGVNDYYTAAYFTENGTFARNKDWNAGHGAIEQQHGIVPEVGILKSLSGKVVVVGNTKFFVIDTDLAHLTPEIVNGMLVQGYTPMFQWGSFLSVSGNTVVETPIR
jgi:hypothetical protein